MTRKEPENDFTQEEAQRRFEKLVRTALNTPPKPVKDRPLPQAESKRKARKPADQRS